MSDIDDTVRATHGYLKQRSGFGYTGVRGLNVLLGTICTPLAAPVIAGTRHWARGRPTPPAARPVWSPASW